ncbi:GNAT family N-acetyltransferase [Nocardia farcinica]|uniref:GNAT family N-acetyltransferase n=1 Tax=Nocardia farcinica TaxID=37329 RepID=UPI002456F72D|nr:GNAT family N-acetyltransferase [Nocardia farcinica]
MPESLPPVIDPATFTAPQPTLTGAGDLPLRPWRDDDAPADHAAFQDPAIRRWHVRTADSVDQVLGWLPSWRAAWTSGNPQWAVTCAGELAGRIGLRRTDLNEGGTELAYWTTPARRGHGIAPRAAFLLLRWAFHDIGFERVELTHSVLNPQSCRVADKCGFALEGTLRGAGRHHDGRHDMHLHARLRTD